MKNVKYLVFIFIVLPGILYSQGTVFNPFKVNELKSASVTKNIKDAVDDAKIVEVDLNIVNQILNNKSESINIKVNLNNVSQNFNLRKFDVIDNTTKIVGGTLSGDRNVTPQVNFAAYTSDLHDKNSPMVVMTFSENEVSAIIVTNEDTYVLGRTDKDNVNSDYILFASSKVKIRNDFNCGSEIFEVPQRIKDMQKNFSNVEVDYATSDILRANIAIESDFEFYTFSNGTLNATNYILRLMSAVSAIYTRDMNIRLVVTYLRVWETSSDPYPDATSSNTLLTAFRSYWNSNMSSVPRTIAHYITTRPGGLGGIAYLGVLCSSLTNGFGYAFSDIDGTFSPLPAYSWDIMVVSHETGHNFGSPHTHSCGWSGGPIDSCYAVEGGCYSGPPIARVGTIMSYCHLNGSISLVQGFGPQPTQLIRASAESAGCITTSTGYYVAYPNGGDVLRGNTTAYIVWGTSNTGNVDIDYSTNNGSSWTSVQTNVSASLRTISWTVPNIPTTTQARIRVYQSGNPGTADQSDSVFQIRPALLSFNMVSPPQLSRYVVYPNDTTKLYFTWTRVGTFPEIKYKWNLNNFNNTINYNTFSNSNGSDSVMTMSIGKLDSIIASWGINQGDSIRARWFVKAYSQLDSASPTSSSFLITFVRSVIGIQPISEIIPKNYFINPNYPNPFNPVTNIEFGLPKQSFVRITVYNVLGKEVAILANDNLKAGQYKVDWNADNFPSGVYFYKIDAGDFVKTAKMMLVK